MPGGIEESKSMLSTARDVTCPLCGTQRATAGESGQVSCLACEMVVPDPLYPPGTERDAESSPVKVVMRDDRTSARGWMRSVAYADDHAAECVVVDAPQSIVREPPFTVDQPLWWQMERQLKSVWPGAHVATVERGHVWGPEPAILGPDGVLLVDLCGRARDRAPADHPVFEYDCLGPAADVDGSVAVLAARGSGRNYFHWMFDSLPKLELLRRSGLAVDAFVVNSLHLPCHLEALERLSVPLERVLELRTLPHVVAQQVVATTPTRTATAIPAWVCTFLRQTFGPQRAVSRTSRLYVTRATASHRRVVNEQDVVELLSSRGFEVIYDVGERSLGGQAQLFGSAEVVVSPLGAALTNIVHCAKGTAVVELFAPTAVHSMFWQLSCLLGLRYAYVIGEGERPDPAADVNRPQDDLVIDLTTLERTLDSLGVTSHG